MSAESLLIAAGIVTVAVCIGIVLAPLLQADMRRTVERANDNTPPDLTAWAIGIIGPGGWLFIVGAAGWLWVA